eukprot:1179774-Prorocentrum_minimum.AAC.1
MENGVSIQCVVHPQPTAPRQPTVQVTVTATSSMAPPGLSKRDLATIFACSVVNLSTSYSVSVAFPIIPLYANTHQIDEVYAGSILGATSFAYLMSSPVIGFALLRWRCKTLMLWGLVLIALGDLLFVVVPVPLVMLMARTVTGVGNAAAEIAAMTFVSRNYTEHIGKCMSAFEVFQLFTTNIIHHTHASCECLRQHPSGTICAVTISIPRSRLESMTRYFFSIMAKQTRRL